ncbi:hypothetical protein Sjap_011334 [Stephania japonica]|uniref:DNA replication ATP-dependent helicase/nuclease n=1 Tax=Stephania japonica TaxID=461633 RepID=A0AAP0JDB6_9MAGN
MVFDNAFLQVQLANPIEKEAIDGSRLHRKALLELLDQVEDVISVEESMDNDLEMYSCKTDDTKRKHLAVESNSLKIAPKRVNCLPSNINFLVLEVSEKHRTDDSSCLEYPVKVLHLLNEQSGRAFCVHLHDSWFYSVVGAGDTINVIGDFDEQGKCVVDNESNLLIVHPDILLSGTRVASSFICSRRSVLDERLKCKEHSTAALFGTLLHHIFQAGLTREDPTRDYLEDCAREVIQKHTEIIYACEVNEKDVRTTLIEAIPRMLNWLKCFHNSQERKASVADFGSTNGQKNVNITEVIDIEEMAWAPRYGLKGVIDASVQANIYSNVNGPNEQKIMPLEFKTGKGTCGQAKHRAQVVLYTLLMSERYLKQIDTALLYYLHTDQTQVIAVQRSDLVGLIMRRNELASDLHKASTMQQLPPMLQVWWWAPLLHKQGAFWEKYQGALRKSMGAHINGAHGGHSANSGLGAVFDSQVEHLSHSHLVFLQHWDRLIDLEAKETQVGNPWRLPSQKECYSDSLSAILEISKEVSPKRSPKDGRFTYNFSLKDLPPHDSKMQDKETASLASSSINSCDSRLKRGDYVVLSTGSGHLAVAKGIIMDVNRFHISISFSRRLRLPGASPTSDTADLLREVWLIDKDEYKSSFAVMRFNLMQLFLQNVQSSHLRRMVVDLEVLQFSYFFTLSALTCELAIDYFSVTDCCQPPRFEGGIVLSQDPAVSYIRSEKNLNNDQRRAIHKILAAKDYALILGMPGTGKTSTMVHAVKALLMRGVSILLTSYTNSAVDNLLIKLKYQGIDFLRIGRHEAVHEEVRDSCLSDRYTVEEIKARLDEVKVIAVTCLGISHPLLAKKKFDICIMDEAGQITLPVSLGPLMLATKFVLVGDHYQLPPLVQSTEARENGMGISLFRRLSEAHPEAISALQCQYRMCAGIMDLSNALIYGNRLRCGSSEIANAKLKFIEANYTMPWLKEADMLPALEVKEHKTVSNPLEASIVSKITSELLKKGITEDEIGIITPYNSQANRIRCVLGTTNIEMHTIDKYQGRDKDCILVSFVRSSECPRFFSSSLLGDWHRINVALTRAKKKLIMVGSCRTLSKVPLLKLLIEKVDEQFGIEKGHASFAGVYEPFYHNQAEAQVLLVGLILLLYVGIQFSQFVFSARLSLRPVIARMREQVAPKPDLAGMGIALPAPFLWGFSWGIPTLP